MENSGMKNWAGNLEYTAAEHRQPRTIDELAEIVVSSQRVKALGSRHSFNDSADTSGVLVSLGNLSDEVEIDRANGLVRVGAGRTYAEVGAALQSNGFALHNLASLPHISVAGAVQTGTHGSGVANGSLASAVRAFDIVRSSGETETLQAGDPDFDASVVGLGAIGIVTSVTLAVEPTFEITQHVHEAMPWDAALANWSAVTGSAYSVSVFTTFQGENTHQIWVKRRVDSDVAEFDFVALGGRESLVPLHPLPDVLPDALTGEHSTTVQLRQPGPWNERLPHFRSEFQPSHGDEIQSEYLIPAGHAVPAIEALRGISDLFAPLLYISELRTIAADAAWLSPSQGRDSLAIHFTWKQRPAEILAVLPRIEEALAPFDPRPHWGKVSKMPRERLRLAYPRLDDFAALAGRVDPLGKFRNSFLDRAVFPA